MPRKKGDGVPLTRVTIAIDRRDLWKICRVAAEDGVGHTTWMRDRLLEALAAHAAKKKNAKKNKDDGRSSRSRSTNGNARRTSSSRASRSASSRRTQPSAR